MKIVDSFKENEAVTIYTIELSEGLFVDIIKNRETGLTYIMENANRSQVYGRNGTDETYPDSQFHNQEVLEFVNKNEYRPL